MIVCGRGLGEIPDLWKATYDLVSQVPYGMVTTYGHVARALGDVVASRFVGLAMSLNKDTAQVPCRRVVQSDGKLGGYTGGGPEKKAALLRSEGVTVAGGKVSDLDRLLFADFVSDRPLENLRQRQRRLRGLVKTPRKDIDVRHVAGVDVAYRGELAFAAATVYDYATGEMVDSVVHRGRAPFPYVPTYLAFRELPLITPLVKDMPEGTVLMYDGNGLLHPEGMGIATHAGIAFRMPSIGVAKSLLCGVPERPSEAGAIPLLVGGRTAGFELRRREPSRPIYVSVGNGMSARQMLTIVRRFMKHRIPEPTRTAHTLACRARGGTTHK